MTLMLESFFNVLPIGAGSTGAFKSHSCFTASSVSSLTNSASAFLGNKPSKLGTLKLGLNLHIIKLNPATNKIAPVPKPPTHLIIQALVYSPNAPPHENAADEVTNAKQVLNTNKPTITYLMLRHKLNIGLVKNKLTPKTKKKLHKR